MNKVTDADYERMVRERDEALARVDSQRSQIAYYRTACTARFLPEGFGDETIRELIEELAEERDEARAQVDELRGQYQYSVGLSMALEERDQARRERDEWRDKFHALNQTAGELCDACGWAFKIPGELCRCEVVKERDEARAEVERLRSVLSATSQELADIAATPAEERALALEMELAVARAERDEARAERDEARAKYQWMVDRACDEKLDGYRELGAKCAQLEEERDEARAEVERLRTALLEVQTSESAPAWFADGFHDGWKAGAEAMREACAAALMADGLVLSRERAANVVRALPIPEEQ